jgi:hypothetical protein
MRYLPLCAVCGLPVRYPMVIEVLIPDTPRGTEVDAGRKACWVQENCVLIHPGECYKIAVTDAGRLVCTHSLIKADMWGFLLFLPLYVGAPGEIRTHNLLIFRCSVVVINTSIVANSPNNYYFYPYLGLLFPVIPVENNVIPIPIPIL